MNQRMANEENITDELILLPGDPSAIADPMVPIEEQVKGLDLGEDLPWYKDVYNYVRSPEFRKFDAGELGQSFKGNIKQLGSWYNDLVGLGYNAWDPGGIIPGVGTDDPNFGLIDFFGNMMRQKRQGEFNVPLSEVYNNTEFFEYMNKLNDDTVLEKNNKKQDRFDEIITQTGADIESIPGEIWNNKFSDTDSATDFMQAIRSAGGRDLDSDTLEELDSLMHGFITRQNDEGQYYRDNSIMKINWVNNPDGSVDEENSTVTFGDMPKVDEGPFGLDMILDPGYTPGGDLSLTNLGKFRMVDGKLTRVQPSVQNWLTEMNVNPDRFGGILQSAPGYEALGKFLEDKWVKNVAWQGHDFDFPEGVKTDKEKEGFLLQMYPLMAMGVGAPVSKLLSSPAGKVATGTGGTTLAAAPETKDDLEITLELPYGEQ